MKPVDRTPPGQSETMALEVDLPHPVKKVWRALSEPELLSQWLLPVSGFSLTPKATFAFQAPPQPGWDGMVSCEMLDVVPLERLRYRWTVGGELDTIVTLTLTELPTGTRLTVHQTGFKPHQKQNFGGARYGWNLMAGRLQDLLERLS